MMPLLLVDALYLFVLAVSSIVVAARKGIRLVAILPLIFATYHLAYGIGVLTGISRWALGFNAQNSARRFSTLTR